jgi:hypothetical protein
VLACAPGRHMATRRTSKHASAAVRVLFCEHALSTRIGRATSQIAYNSACTLATAADISAGALRSSGTMTGGSAASGAGEIARHASRTCSSRAMSVAVASHKASCHLLRCTTIRHWACSTDPLKLRHAARAEDNARSRRVAGVCHGLADAGAGTGDPDGLASEKLRAISGCATLINTLHESSRHHREGRRCGKGQSLCKKGDRHC